MVVLEAIICAFYRICEDGMGLILFSLIHCFPVLRDMGGRGELIRCLFYRFVWLGRGWLVGFYPVSGKTSLYWENLGKRGGGNQVCTL